jgi:hypothetical protein
MALSDDPELGLSDVQIARIINNHFPSELFFGGIFPCDRIPPCDTHKPIYYIINTARYGKEGQHWILIFMNTHKDGLVWFDPMGFSPEYYDSRISEFMRDHKQSYVSNSHSVQPVESTNCGFYVLFMSDKICHGLSLAEAMQLFPSTIPSRLNDVMVVGYVNCHMLAPPILNVSGGDMCTDVTGVAYKSGGERRLHHRNLHRGHRLTRRRRQHRGKGSKQRRGRYLNEDTGT